MNERKFDVKKFDSISNSLLVLALASVTFYLSLLYRTGGGIIRLSIFSYFNSMAYSVFGIMHALHLFLYLRHNGRNVGVLDFISCVLVCWAFYSVVLLPASGFALAEWMVVALYLFSGLVSSVTPLRGDSRERPSSNPVWLMAMGMLLLLFKVMLWWAAPNNLYLSAIAGNKTLRTMLALLCGAGIVIMLSQLAGRLKKKGDGQKKNGIASGVKKGLDIVKSILSSLWQFMLMIFSGPVILIIICIAILLLGIWAALFSHGFISDIEALFEPILDRMLTTGQDGIVKSKLYAICQLSALVLSTLFQIILLLPLAEKTDEAETEFALSGEKKETAAVRKSGKPVHEVRTPEVIHLGESKTDAAGMDKSPSGIEHKKTEVDAEN